MKVSKSKLLIQIIYVILLFQIALQYSSIKVISVLFNYIDDAIAAFCILYVALKLFKGIRLEKVDSLIFETYILFSLVGFLGSVFFKMQSFKAVFFDFMTCSKFIFAFFAARLYCRKFKGPFIKDSVNRITKIISLVLFVLAINDEFFSPIFPIFDYRYFGRSIMLLYPHPTYLAVSCIAMMLVLTATEDERNMKYLIMNSIIILFTFRAKAMAFLTVFWGIYLLRYVFQVKSKAPYIIASILLSVFVGYDQFVTYFQSTNWSARAVMLADAITVAKRYFPLGAGFASFGTNMSVAYYSPLYFDFGYNLIMGMSKDSAAFLNDGFWQAVIGQFGFLGVFCFVRIIYLLFRDSINHSLNMSPLRFVSVLSLNVYLIIASLGEMAYFAPYAITLFFILGAILDENVVLNNLNIVE